METDEIVAFLQEGTPPYEQVDLRATHNHQLG